jgi:hypothetical protein
MRFIPQRRSREQLRDDQGEIDGVSLRDQEARGSWKKSAKQVNICGLNSQGQVPYPAA